MDSPRDTLKLKSQPTVPSLVALTTMLIALKLSMRLHALKSQDNSVVKSHAQTQEMNGPDSMLLLTTSTGLKIQPVHHSTTQVPHMKAVLMANTSKVVAEPMVISESSKYEPDEH